MTLKEFLGLYSDCNTNIVLNTKKLNLYVEVDPREMDEKNYENVLKAKVLSFSIRGGELYVRIDY